MCVVYWLFDETCSFPQTEGYIGVSTNWPTRLKQHRRRRGAPFEAAVLFEGSKEECLALEHEFRPRPCIGWNFNYGGEFYGPAFPPMQGRKHSAETLKRMRGAALKRIREGRGYQGGNKRQHSEETKAKIRTARAKQTVEPHLGVKHNDAARAKISKTRKERWSSYNYQRDNKGRMIKIRPAGT
jgi:hypothetical protein